MAAPPTPSLVPARRLDGRLLLTESITEVTLDRRQSAIGSLTFELAGHGELGVFWELQDTTSGLVSPLEGQLVSPELGRRPVVEHLHGQVIVGLRHVKQVRRLVVLVEGPETRDPYRLVANLHDGSSLEMSIPWTAPVISALAVYQVQSELVVRREALDFASRSDVADAYGFARAWVPTRR